MASRFNDRQLEAITARNGQVLIAAGAGSGKSTVLVERLMRKIIDEGVDVDAFLIVTFTNLAAKEMLGKIRKALTKAASDSGNNQQHLKNQLYKLPYANVSTFHGFCIKILRRYYYLVDLDVNVSVMEDMAATLLLSQTLDAFMDEAYKDEDFQFLSDIFSADREDKKFKTLLSIIYQNAIAMPHFEDWLDDLKKLYDMVDTIDDWAYYDKVKQLIFPMLDAAQGFIQEAQDCAFKSHPDHGYLEVYEADKKLIDALGEALATGTYETVRNMLLGTELLSMPRKKKDWEKDNHDQASSARKNFVKLKDTLLENFFAYSTATHHIHFNHGKKVTKALAHYIKQLDQQFLAAKKQMAQVDFSDLERYTLHILTHNRDAKEEIAQQFAEIMIDEYQDTNPMQETIVTLLAGAVTPNIPIFMVGDIKQSIYRFRGAKPSIFSDKYENYAYGETVTSRKIDLMQNYRSSDAVVDGTNYLMAHLMDKPVAKIQYDEAAWLKLGKTGDDLTSQTTFLQHDNSVALLSNQPELFVIDAETAQDESAEEESLEKAEIEAHVIAQKIRAMIDEAQYLWDSDEKTYRLAKFSDMVILLRSMTPSQTFLRILSQYDIPVTIETTGSLLDTLEVSNVREMLRIIDNPKQDIPLLGVMKSPMFNFTSEQLAHIRIHQPEVSIYDAVKNYAISGTDVALRRAVEGFLKQLQHLRYVSTYESIEGLLYLIYETTGYYQFVLGRQGGDVKALNLDGFVRVAQSYETYTTNGLYGFLRHLDYLESLDKMLPAATESAGDGVKMMTIHKSKGLEFPVVFVAQMHRNFDTRDEMGDYLIHKEWGIGVQYIDARLRLKQKSLPARVIAGDLHEEMLAEEMRLLYVALTRAESKVILTGVVGKTSSLDALEVLDNTPSHVRLSGKNFLDWVIPVVSKKDEVNPWLYERIETVDCLGTFVSNPDVLAEVFVDEGVDLKGLLRVVNLRMDLAFVTAKQSVTQRKLEETVPLYRGIAETLPKPAYDRPSFMGKVVKATEVGTAFHQFMQHLPVEAGHTLESLRFLAQQLADDFILDKEVLERIDFDSILAFTEHELYQRLTMLPEGDVKKELPFTMLFKAGEHPDGHAMLQGVVDLLAAFDDEVWIVDYKTDKIRNFAAQSLELRRRYDIQMKYYLQAVKEIYPDKRVIGKVFFMDATDVIEYR